MDEECSICWEAMREEETAKLYYDKVKLACEHRFHESCIQQIIKPWKCPLCRARFYHTFTTPPPPPIAPKHPQRPRRRTISSDSNTRRNPFQRYHINSIGTTSSVAPAILIQQVAPSHFENRSPLSFPTPTPGLYSLDTLQQSCPLDVDPTRKEEYLTDEIFRDVFGMDRLQFQGLPKWRRNAQKKNANLF